MTSQTENILILDNVRSAHNVGTILRTADAAGLRQVWLCGITPSPPSQNDPRPSYVQERNAKLLAKTALGAEQTLEIGYIERLSSALKRARQTHQILVLEQADRSLDLLTFDSPPKSPWALVVGHETRGVDRSALHSGDTILEIPMRGRKESLNVAVATGIALYRLTS